MFPDQKLNFACVLSGCAPHAVNLPQRSSALLRSVALENLVKNSFLLNVKWKLILPEQAFLLLLKDTKLTVKSPQ